jgi:DNA-binding SARP family transcriptional activator
LAPGVTPGHAVGTSGLLLLGPPLLERKGRAEPIRLRKALALAAYLAVERRAFTREHLAALLWPDLGPQSALANLRRMLSYLRETADGRCIRTTADLVQLDTGQIGVDLVEFQSLLHDGVAGTGLESLEKAAALYRGDFLEGFAVGDSAEFDDWQDRVRRRMQEQLDELLESLCRECLRTGRVRHAVPYAKRWLELDRLNESAHRMLMEIHARSGRVDLARKQYESCVQALAQERIEPERETRDLYDAISRHRLAPDPAAPSPDSGNAPQTERGGPQSSRAGGGSHLRRDRRVALRRARPWMAAAAGSILTIAAIATYVGRGAIFSHDLSVVAVETVLRNEELAGVQFALRNDGMGLPSARYTVAFSSDRAVVAQRDYVVYADKVRMRRDAVLTVEVDRKEIETYIGAHDVRIPPGNYSLTVIIDPDNRNRERTFLDNRREDSSLFFYPGTAPEAAFEVEIAYHGAGILDGDHPLTVYIARSGTSDLREQQWARFVARRDDTYYFPVDDVPERDTDGSGYTMLVIYNARHDPLSLSFPGSGDVSAIYRQGTPDLSYGVFNTASGTAIYPGQRYRIDFSPPAAPAADAYEVDDNKETATVIDDAALPIRQRHTFHDEGTGDTDEDWFRIELKAGETITVETYDAGGPWGCDTAIDIADSRGYILTANDKSELDFYSKLTYKNETGTGHVYYFQVKPWPKYNPGVNRFADYIVEFRR